MKAVLSMLALLALSLVACAPAMPAEDVQHGTDATADTCTTVNGAAACNQATGALCARIIQCCTAAGATCMDWGQSDSACRAHFVANGLDCSAPSRTGAEVCASIVDACVADIPLIACSDIYGGTVNLPHSCAPLP